MKSFGAFTEHKTAATTSPTLTEDYLNTVNSLSQIENDIKDMVRTYHYQQPLSLSNVTALIKKINNYLGGLVKVGAFYSDDDGQTQVTGYTFSGGSLILYLDVYPVPVITDVTIKATVLTKTITVTL